MLHVVDSRAKVAFDTFATPDRERRRDAPEGATPKYYTNATEIRGTNALLTELPGLLRKVVKRA